MRNPIFGGVLPSSDVRVFNDDGVTLATFFAAATGGAALVI